MTESTANGYLRALIPGSILDGLENGEFGQVCASGATSFGEGDEFKAVFHPETGVLNVLTPGVPYSNDGLATCPLYLNSDSLPLWAREALLESVPFATRKEALAYIVASTRVNDEAIDIERFASPVNEEQPPQLQDANEEFCLYWSGSELHALSTIGEFGIERYDLTQNIFSRNTGILESSIMINKRAVILGCGSVGSLVATELARSGVGKFLLIDMDVLEYHNVCRHQCGVSDVGRCKPDAVRDLIRNINPEAHVEIFCSEVQQAPRELLQEWCIKGETLILGCADNRGVDRYGNDVAADYRVPFLSIGFWERAFAGELFYWLPNSDQACYRCVFGSGDVLSQRVEANHHIYTTQSDLAAVNFEPGISVDISFVTLVGVKLALDIFNRQSPYFTQRLLPYLTQYTLVCNTNETSIGGPMAEIFSYPLQVTNSLQVRRDSDCPNKSAEDCQEAIS